MTVHFDTECLVIVYASYRTLSSILEVAFSATGEFLTDRTRLSTLVVQTNSTSDTDN
jgi:hypothetical protein